MSGNEASHSTSVPSFQNSSSFSFFISGVRSAKLPYLKLKSKPENVLGRRSSRFGNSAL
jgi:hypothetical protein